MEVITAMLVKQYPTTSTENLLALLSTIRDVFDAISVSANALENSSNGIVGCDVDLAVLDMQIALQVLVEAFISNCEYLSDVENTQNHSNHDEAIDSAIYCLSSATKTLLTSMARLVEKIVTATEVIDVNAVTGLQMIVQTILNIVDRVLYSLKRITILDLEDVEPSLEHFSLIIQRLATERLSFGSPFSPMIMSPINEILDSLKSNIDQQLPVMTRKNIESVVMALATVEDTVREKHISATIASLLDTLQPMLGELSLVIRTIAGISDAVAYSTDLSLQNLMATIKCLSYYIAIVTKVDKVPTIDPTEIAENLQPMLCFIASTIQTLVDGVTLAAERALADIICVPPTADKLELEKQLLELQVLLEPVFLTLENVVRTSILLVENILILSARAMGDLPDLVRDINMLINNLQRIVKETLESALTRDINGIGDNQIDNGSVAVTNDDDNVLSICVTSFESVALNLVGLRLYVNKSIDQIREYLITSQ